MIIPNAINKNTFKCYETPKSITKKDRKIRSEDFTEWNKNTPDNLKTLCIKCIAYIWKDRPNQLDHSFNLNSLLHTDRISLLDFLLMDIPLNKAVIELDNDYYWEKRYKVTWPKESPPDRNISELLLCKTFDNINNGSVNSFHFKEDEKVSKEKSVSSTKSSTKLLENYKRKSWKQCYIEQHLKNTLENLKPEEYDLEKINDLILICRNFIYSLTLKQLQTQEQSSDNIEHIPLNIILTGLPLLTELSICFKQTYLGEKFSWNAIKVSLQDIKFLGKGLECCDLYSFRIQNSDIDCIKVKMMMEPLLRNENLRVLDLSHCKVSDEGALIICRLVNAHPSLNKVVMTNNLIGYAGAKYFSILLCQKDCRLSHLDLKLNKIGEKGGKFIIEALAKGGKSLKALCLAACCLKSSNWTFGKMISKNKSLEILDISSNKIGEEVGLLLLEGLKKNTAIMHLDIRMCGMTSGLEKEILKEVFQNTKGLKKPSMQQDEINLEEEKTENEIFNNIKDEDFNIITQCVEGQNN